MTGGTVVVSLARAVVALDVDGGSERWRREFDGYTVGASVGGDTIYVAGEGLVGLDRSTGEWQWARSFDGAPMRAPTVTRDAVYVDASTGDHRPYTYTYRFER
ncbi:hypothetical protein BRC81_06275 [Halobacteriales archaeon QS_1_68_20]|nr:MAG: hypothetical protein BRC81_06275 [Halobacteriales archaeon QS_1_68_20]